MFTSKNKLFFVGLAIVTLVPMAALAATAAAATPVAHPAMTPPGSDNLFTARVGLCDMNFQTNGNCATFIDPNNKRDAQLIAPYFNKNDSAHYIKPCADQVIATAEADARPSVLKALEHIKDNPDYQDAKLNFNTVCPAGTAAPKPTLVVGILQNTIDHDRLGRAIMVPEKITFSAKLVDGTTETPLLLGKNDQSLLRSSNNNRAFEQLLFIPSKPSSDGSCSAVDSFVDDLNIDGATSQIVAALNAKAATCQASGGAQSGGPNPIIGHIGQLRGDGSADTQSDSLNLPASASPAL